MPVVKSYRGRPLSRVSKHQDGVLLTYPSLHDGNPRERVVVSQEDWDKYGVKEYVAPTPNESDS